MIMVRRAASRSQDTDAARRTPALTFVLEGASQADAAPLCGMGRQILRDWVHRYNEKDLAGLSARPHGNGPPRLLSGEQGGPLPSWFGPVPIRPCTAWCAGDGPILPR